MCKGVVRSTDPPPGTPEIEGRRPRALPRRSRAHFLRFSALFSLLLCVFSSSRAVLGPFWPHFGAQTLRNAGSARSAKPRRALHRPSLGDPRNRRTSPQSAPKTLWRAILALLCSLFASSLLVFLLSGRFGTILASFWNPWDLKNIAFS